MAFTPASDLDAIQSLYIAYFGRAGEPDGVAYWVDRLNSGQMTFAQVAASFAVQDEARAQHPFLAHPDFGDAGAFVDSLYEQLFNREPDTSGRAYWLDKLEAANGDPIAIGLIIAQFISGADANDSAIIDNKIDAANYFTSELEERGIGGTTDGSKLNPLYADLAHDVVDNEVTASSLSVEESRREVDRFFAPPSPPQPEPEVPSTFAMTTGTDFADGSGSTSNGQQTLFRFMAGRNETVTAASGTLTVGDSLSDPDSTDSDTLMIAASSADLTAISFAVVNGIENIDLTLNSADDLTIFDLANYTGVQSLQLSGSVGPGPEGIFLTSIGLSGVTNIDASGLVGDAVGRTLSIADVTANQDLTVTGTEFNDYFRLGTGNNTIVAGAGDDVMMLGEGNPSIGVSTVDLGDGNDTVQLMGDGDATVTGGAGSDTIFIVNSDANNIISTGGDADTISISGNGDNNVDTGDGDDIIGVGGGGDNYLAGGEGIDTIIVQGNGDNTIVGEAGADHITLVAGSNGQNRIVIEAGDSDLSAGDQILGFVSAEDSINLVGLPQVNFGNADEGVIQEANFNAAFLSASFAIAGGLTFAFTYDSLNGYVFADSDDDGDIDIVVTLAGIDHTEFDILSDLV